MKRPQPDLNKEIVDTYIAKMGANRKLKRLWGTTTVNGTSVLNARRHYHKKEDRPSNYETLFKFLKVYNDIKDYEGEGIKSAWFTLNKSKYNEDISVYDSYIVYNLNSMWWDTNDGPIPENLTLTTSIVIGGKFDGSGGIGSLNLNSTNEDILNYVKNNYESLWSTNSIIQEGVGIINKGSVYDDKLKVDVPDEDDLSPDDPWLSVISRYALRDDGIPCTIKNVDIGLGDVLRVMYNSIIVTIEIPYHEFSESDDIVARISNDISNYVYTPIFSAMARYNNSTTYSGLSSSNEAITQSEAKKQTFYLTTDDIDVDVITRDYIHWEDAKISTSKYEDYWVQDLDGVWYFKSDVIDNPKKYGTTHQELNEYVFGILDTGYKKAKVPFWKKLVAVVVFIIAVVLAFFSYGSTSGYAGAAYAAAYAVLVGAAVVSLIILVSSALGANEWSSAFAWLSKEIEPLVAVASVVMIASSFYTKGFGTATSELMQKELSSAVLDEVLQEFGDLGSLIADAMSGSLSDNSLNTLTRAINSYSSVQLAKLEDINSKNADLKVKYEKLIEETSMDSDIMRSYMNIYPKPATADWSMYASTFDLPYERAGGNLSTGNIQRTTKQAIRKADYEDAIFEGILII